MDCECYESPEHLREKKNQFYERHNRPNNNCKLYKRSIYGEYNNSQGVMSFQKNEEFIFRLPQRINQGGPTKAPC